MDTEQPQGDLMKDEISATECLREILGGYLKARDGTFGSSSSLWSAFRRLAAFVGESPGVVDDHKIRVRWSMGQGRWATIPWIALLDQRETNRVTDGVYVVYLFREDMTGAYISLNQGASDLLGMFRQGAFARLRSRASAFSSEIAPSLENTGFSTGEQIDLRATRELGRAYEAGAIASKLYSPSNLPGDRALREDLAVLLRAYQRVVPSERTLRNL